MSAWTRNLSPAQVATIERLSRSDGSWNDHGTGFWVRVHGIAASRVWLIWRDPTHSRAGGGKVVAEILRDGTPVYPEEPS